MDASRAREWHMFLGTRDSDTAAAELLRQVQRLDDAIDIVSYVLRLLSGSPSGDLDENLRVGRTALNEGIRDLQRVANEFRNHTDVA